MVFKIMTKENNAAVLILLTNADFKDLINDGIPLRNFEFRKKIVVLLIKCFFSRSFHKSELELKGNSIELSTFLKYGLTEVKKAPL